MNSMVAGRCRSTNVVHLRRGYQKPIVVTTPILDHKDGHYVRPNRVVFKYPILKKNVDLDVHVRMFNSIVKEMQRLLKSISLIHLIIR
jgi:hypothetical protein